VVVALVVVVVGLTAVGLAGEEGLLVVAAGVLVGAAAVGIQVVAGGTAAATTPTSPSWSRS
jgi:hypothetical protein